MRNIFLTECKEEENVSPITLYFRKKKTKVTFILLQITTKTVYYLHLLDLSLDKESRKEGYQGQCHFVT